MSVGRPIARHGIELGIGMRRLVVVATLLLAAASPARADFKDGEAAHSRGDFVAALSEFRPLAMAGNAQAQFYLGFIYRNGQGTREDFAEAVTGFRPSQGCRCIRRSLDGAPTTRRRQVAGVGQDNGDRKVVHGRQEREQT